LYVHPAPALLRVEEVIAVILPLTAEPALAVHDFIVFSVKYKLAVGGL